MRERGPPGVDVPRPAKSRSREGRTPHDQAKRQPTIHPLGSLSRGRRRRLGLARWRAPDATVLRLTASHADAAVLVSLRGLPCGCMVGHALALVAASDLRGSNSWPACARRPSAVRALTQVQGARYVDFHAATALITRDRPRESDVPRVRSRAVRAANLPRLAVDGGLARLPGRRVHRLEASADASTPSTPRWSAARSPEPASAPSSGGPRRARSGARQPGSAPAPSATPSGWRPAPRWSATRPTSARSP